MLFNSTQFLFFFPIVTVLYFLLPHRFRWQLLLLASCAFYMAFIPAYILILLVTIVIDYFAAILMETPGISPKKKRTFLVVSIWSTCLVLFVFKYFDFFVINYDAVASFFGWNLHISTLKIILPIGLSFHTFQSLSYVVEVYRGKQKAERHFGIYSLYVMFYPQLVAGPIERPQNLLHQFYEEHLFDYQRVTDGLKLMLWGMFKKIVIADRLAVVVSMVYGNPQGYTGWPLILATVFFTFQIYCDFSGYSDVAIGAAQVMGFRLMDNFNRPYFAKSIAQFWSRWHISLTTWFRDYVFLPLSYAVSRKIKSDRVCLIKTEFLIYMIGISATWLLTGLWHGANWTYVVWGGINGIYLIFSLGTQRIRQSLCKAIHLKRYPTFHKYLRIGLTFSLVNIAWIFFRASSIPDAWYILTHLFQGLHSGFKPVGLGQLLQLGLTRQGLCIAMLSIGFMELIHFIQRHRSIRHMLTEKPIWFRWAVYYALVFGIVLFGIFSERQFIYFQF
ncbi:MAG TPA: membrane-bound O-acyltransferase family protein [Elusimicrobia bacterium]|nr:membrane-bound O-acyltransferase family protein [Elusimicrobiota bacterium]